MERRWKVLVVTSAVVFVLLTTTVRHWPVLRTGPRSHRDP